IANLLYRRGASPRLVSKLDGQKATLVAAASLKTVPDAVWRAAEDGAMVVIDDAALAKPSWRRVKQEQDRDFYDLGRGRVVVYKKRVVDPSEFALDVIDLVGHRQRTARTWNARSSVAFATAGPASGEALLFVVNYGAAQNDEVQA